MLLKYRVITECVTNKVSFSLCLSVSSLWLNFNSACQLVIIFIIVSIIGIGTAIFYPWDSYMQHRSPQSQCILRLAPPKWNCFLRLCISIWVYITTILPQTKNMIFTCKRYHAARIFYKTIYTQGIDNHFFVMFLPFCRHGFSRSKVDCCVHITVLQLFFLRASQNSCCG